jgi:Mrp family chromosome partitioning ATPase
VIADRTLGRDVLSARDFSGDGKSLEITPPDKASPGTYGASTITVTFTWSDPRVAQLGANAVLQAFDEARSASIKAQGDATVAGIERAMADARSQDQRADLEGQRTQLLVNQQIDLAHHPMISTAIEPQVPVNGNSKQGGALGLLIGAALGTALAFARASWRTGFEDRLDPAALYGVPLLGEVPDFGSTTRTKKRSTPAATADRLPTGIAPRFAAEAFRFVAGSIERARATRIPRRSLVFVSPLAGAGTSTVVVNTALAIAEGGTRVLVVDAAEGGALTRLLLPDNPGTDGFEQVVTGQRTATDCVRQSPLSRTVSVLGAGLPGPDRVTGSAYSKAVARLLAEAKDDYDVVLVDSPALLQVAAAATLVSASDAAIIVLGPHELIRDHRDMADRLDLIECEILGYVYNRAPLRTDRVPSGRDDLVHPVGSPVPQPSPTTEQSRPESAARGLPQTEFTPAGSDTVWLPSPHPRTRPNAVSGGELTAPSDTGSQPASPQQTPR